MVEIVFNLGMSSDYAIELPVEFKSVRSIML